MIRQALILAAGRGRPVADPDSPNCLATVGGAPLLLRALRVLHRHGIRRVGITVGFEADKIRRALKSFAAAEALPEIAIYDNPAFERPNGLSVLAARTFVTERTLLLMADQIAAPHLIKDLARLPEAGDATVLGVDRDLDRVFDWNDATKVKVAAGKVTAISKELAEADAVSTSLFVVSPTLLACLDALPEPSLTQGVNEAARRGLVDAWDVRGGLWQDVDSADMRLHAEWLLRAYGDDLEFPAVHAERPSPATDTLALIEQLLAEKDAPRFVLMNPGPVMTSPAVKAALVHHDMCHRDQDYSDVVGRLRDKLLPLFGAGPEHELVLVTGSGTAAMELAISSVVPPDKRLLTVENGAFGERLGEIAELHGIARVSLRKPWGALPEAAEVAALLDQHPEVAVVAMIHHETSVGVMNPVAAVGKVCRERDVLLVVDAVSSLGAEDLDVVRDHVDLAFSSANKCLHGVSGVSFLCVAPRVWPRVEAVAPRVYYLDLKRYRKYVREIAQTPFTPAVSTLFALETAVDELVAQGGIASRREVYRRRNLRIRRVLSDLGFQSFTNTGRESHTIVTMRVPSFIAVDALYERMKGHGYIIYKCKGALAADHIQVANMGELSDDTVSAFLETISAVVEEARRAAGTGERARLRSVP